MLGTTGCFRQLIEAKKRGQLAKLMKKACAESATEPNDTWYVGDNLQVYLLEATEQLPRNIANPSNFFWGCRSRFKHLHSAIPIFYFFLAFSTELPIGKRSTFLGFLADIMRSLKTVLMIMDQLDPADSTRILHNVSQLGSYSANTHRQSDQWIHSLSLSTTNGYTGMLTILSWFLDGI